jgi:hypothetical protein
MTQRVAKKTLYLNVDKTEVVSEDSPDAAFLLTQKGVVVDDAEVARLEKLGVKVNLDSEDAEAYDAKADHVALHEGETDAEAKAKRAALFAKAAAPKTNKAVTTAPEDK